MDCWVNSKTTLSPRLILTGSSTARQGKGRLSALFCFIQNAGTIPGHILNASTLGLSLRLCAPLRAGSEAHTTFDVGYSDARRADTQDLPSHSWSFPRVLSQPSGLDECQSVWAITAKQPYARSAPSTPPPLAPPAKAPVEKVGQAVGWSGRIDRPESSQALKGRNPAPCCQGAVTQASSNWACFMLFPAVTK